METMWSDDEVNRELRRLAHRHLRHHGRGTLHTTALVHEVYVRLKGADGTAWESRRHFLCIAARAMRNVLVDDVRSGNASKRGGGKQPVRIEEVGDIVDPRAVARDGLLVIHEALDRLAREHPELAPLAELRFFGGLNVREVAEIARVEQWRVKLASAYLRGYLE